VSESPEISTQSSSITASMTIHLEGDGKPSVVRSTEIAEVVAEFLTDLEPTSVWHVTLKATSSA
jgi:hypothetical protein